MSTTETATARRRFRLRRRHLIALLVVLAALCGGIFGIAQWATSSKSKPAVAAANTFYENLVHDDFPAAYGELCSTSHKLYTQESFATAVKGQPVITAHEPDSVRLATVNGTDSAIVTMNLTLDGGAVAPQQVEVRKEGGKWLVCWTPLPR